MFRIWTLNKVNNFITIIHSGLIIISAYAGELDDIE